MFESLTNQVSEIGDLGSASPPTKTPEPVAIPTLQPASRGSIETIQAGFSDVYKEVLPSVVNIQVVQIFEQGVAPDSETFPFEFPFQSPEDAFPNRRAGLGSGFLWDKEGHIVTNNHVVENADQISVTFHDGTSVDGIVIGADRDSDLAVVKVDYPAERLQPIQVADSTQVEVGQLVAAIGNPFGLQGTMTIGIISALGRSLPIGSRAFQGSTYAIPDVIQTDAPINPGNSGGVLVDMDAKLIGVPTAIESSSGVNAGIGFVVPSVIVQKVVPELIKKGSYDHPWIGISGTTLNSKIAEKMDLARDQRGILVVDVIPESPADEAGLNGSDHLADIDGQEIRLGGDVIVQIDSQPTQDFEDLTAYLSRYTVTGQTVVLTILRDGAQETLDLTLGVRPTTPQIENQQESSPARDAWLGILGLTIIAPIAEAMDLPVDQRGVLIHEVVDDSPAAEAGLRGGDQPITTNGQQVLIGGDLIVAINDQAISNFDDLSAEISKYRPNDQVTLTILRDGKPLDVQVTLGKKP
jgi:S1-C subfamily serine protease